MEWLNDPALMARAEFKAAGMGEVAYVRSYNVKNQTAFVVHAADGTAIAVQKDVQAAKLTARDQGLDIVSVH